MGRGNCEAGDPLTDPLLPESPLGSHATTAFGRSESRDAMRQT